MSSVSPAPLVFWRETEGGRRGLACSVQFCDNPVCTCEEALIQGFEVDESFHSLVSRGDRVVVRSLAGATGTPPARRVSVVVDFEDRSGKDREKRSLFLREWKEVQERLRPLTGGAPIRRPRVSRP